MYDNCDKAIDIIGPEYKSMKNFTLIQQEDISESEDDNSDEDEQGGLLGERQLEEPVIMKPNTRTPLLLQVADRGHARMVTRIFNKQTTNKVPICCVYEYI